MSMFADVVVMCYICGMKIDVLSKIFIYAY